MTDVNKGVIGEMGGRSYLPDDSIRAYCWGRHHLSQAWKYGREKYCWQRRKQTQRHRGGSGRCAWQTFTSHFTVFKGPLHSLIYFAQQSVEESKDIECSQHKVMINVLDDGYANKLDLITTHYMPV